MVFSLAFGTSWLLYLHRYAFGFIMPALKEEWDLSKSELGLIDSAFSLSYALFQFPLGIATDALGVRLILPVLIVVWCMPSLNVAHCTTANFNSCELRFVGKTTKLSSSQYFQFYSIPRYRISYK